MNLKIDVAATGNKQQIVATISSNTFVTTAIASRAAYSKKNPAPESLVGKYTLYLPPASPTADAQRDPRGNGIGMLTVKKSGNVIWEGTLADGTKVAQTEPLTRNNTWPLFLKLYKNRGVMLGNITMDGSQPQSDLSGVFNWFKPVVSKDVYFPLGFRVIDADFFGSKYVPPAKGVRALDGFQDVVNNGRVTIQQGSLLADIVRPLTYTAKNKITISNPGVDELALAIDPETGTLSGSFIHPVSGDATRIKGVLFQKTDMSFGRFQGSSVPGVNPQTGTVLFESVVAPTGP